MQPHKNTILFVLTNILGKSLAAFAQLYAIVVITKTQSQENSAIIFLLLGYAVWFQVLEFGFSQSIQNKFNSRSLSAQGLLKVLLFHYSFLMAISIFININPKFSEIFLSADRVKSNPSGTQAFSIGAAILILASSNTILQRFLLIVNKGHFGNGLIILQSLIVIGGLSIYQLYDQTSPVLAVVAYLGPQVIVSAPILIRLMLKLLRIKKTKPINRKLITSLFSFMGVGVLSALFLGFDYYFAAHYLNDIEIVSYFLVTRIFFISYIIYFAFLQYRSRKLWFINLKDENQKIIGIVKQSCVLGLAAVLITYLIAIILEEIGIFKLITYDVGVGQLLLFLGYIYFTIRVLRDVGLIIVGNLGVKRLLYQIHLIETLLGFTLMYVLTPDYGAIGILVSLILACLAGFIFLISRIIFNINCKATLR